MIERKAMIAGTKGESGCRGKSVGFSCHRDHRVSFMDIQTEIFMQCLHVLVSVFGCDG